MELPTFSFPSAASSPILGSKRDAEAASLDASSDRSLKRSRSAPADLSQQKDLIHRADSSSPLSGNLSGMTLTEELLKQLDAKDREHARIKEQERLDRVIREQQEEMAQLEREVREEEAKRAAYRVHCHGEIHKFTKEIKDYTEDGRIDAETIEIFVESLVEFAKATNRGTPEQLSMIRSVFLSPDPLAGVVKTFIDASTMTEVTGVAFAMPGGHTMFVPNASSQTGPINVMPVTPPSSSTRDATSTGARYADANTNTAADPKVDYFNVPTQTPITKCYSFGTQTPATESYSFGTQTPATESYSFGTKTSATECWSTWNQTPATKCYSFGTQTSATRCYDVSTQTAKLPTPSVSNYELWRRELRTIRRPRSLIKPQALGGVKKVSTRLRQPPAPTKEKPVSAIMKPSSFTSSASTSNRYRSSFMTRPIRESPKSTPPNAAGLPTIISISDDSDEGNEDNEGYEGDEGYDDYEEDESLFVPQFDGDYGDSYRVGGGSGMATLSTTQWSGSSAFTPIKDSPIIIPDDSDEETELLATHGSHLTAQSTAQSTSQVIMPSSSAAAVDPSGLDLPDYSDMEDGFNYQTTSHRVGGATMAYGPDGAYIVESVEEEDDDEYLSMTQDNSYDYGEMGPPEGTHGQVLARIEDRPRQQQQAYPQYSRERPSFYGYAASSGSGHQTDHELRYQSRSQRVGCLPSPHGGLRLHLDDYLHDIDARTRRDIRNSIGRILEETSWGGFIMDEDESFEREWLQDSHSSIIEGFPLVEDIQFLVLGNHKKPDGDCYWRAVSYNIYGTDRHWDLVKAEHLAFMYQVLSHEGHPRHALYAEKLNSKFFSTASVTGLTPFKANLWQLLHMPHAWTPGIMEQITADLYNIFLVTFSYDSNKKECGEVCVRGAYNSRHIFMLYANDAHFQPMTPNDYYGYEFRYPRVTVEATAKFTHAPRAGSKKDGLAHPWRNDFTKEVPAPIPRSHGCNVDKLRDVMGSRPQS
ncbi:Uu.00g047210.m01.CDS01 [Anthostomella pinea]|uniref:Uu.00g047210.m01.CDS01 n=1 Tax=Anthostomella pinea TaxID=933095 RepID=A0AAI8VBL2_9PEZI|nr:Uu.00g047210.m01.CDS01 [Anthostomella pinea]